LNAGKLNTGGVSTLFLRNADQTTPLECKLFFNNMVVLSRAFWVQDDSACDCDDHTIFRSGHKTVSAKQTYSVVDMSVVLLSPVELSRFHCGLTENLPGSDVAALIQRGCRKSWCSRSNFFANQGGMRARQWERTSVRDRCERATQRRVAEIEQVRGFWVI
jgi:hypothetical protein